MQSSAERPLHNGISNPPSTSRPAQKPSLTPCPSPFRFRKGEGSLLAAIALAAAFAASPLNAAPLELSADRCPLIETMPEADDRARVRCGYLQVPEDHAKPAGTKIDIAVAVVQPKSNKRTDPVVMIHGGPGGGEMANYRYRLGEPLGERTLILFDQRGAGYSNPLCPELGEALFKASVRGLSPDAETAELVVAHKRCHDALVAEKRDLTKYNTDATVADMEALRKALGLERWKVYGVSYGTAVALAYLRDHADRIDALVLDSVYPLDAPPASDLIVNMMRSFNALAASCAAQAACKSRFGDLEAAFHKTVAGLARNPLEVPAMGATADWTEAVKISAPAFLTVVHQLLYDRTAYEALPYIIDRVAARDGEVFALLVEQFHERAIGITHGAYAAVECYERFPFDSREEFELATAAWPDLRDNMTLIARHFDVCANWGERAPARMTMPSRTTVPTLVLAGGWDPITPPAYSKATAELLGAHYVEIPLHGHGARGDRNCGAPVIRAFLQAPARAPDVACAGRTRPPIFATGLIRAPLLAQGMAALATSGNPAAAPVTSALVVLLVFMVLSVAAWGLVAALRRRLIQPALLNPKFPLALATIAIASGVASLAYAFVSAAGTSSPILLMIGLPGSSLPLFALGWAGALLLGWSAWLLFFTEANEDRGPLATAHIWAVFTAGVAVLLLLAYLGLLVPDLI